VCVGVGGGVGVCVGVCVWGGGCMCVWEELGLFLTWPLSTQPILAGFSPINSLGPNTHS